MDTDHVILAGSLIDGSGAPARKKCFLSVQQGTITAIGSMDKLDGSCPGTRVDLSHCTIVPALVDCSVSLSQSPSSDNNPPQPLPQREQATMLKRHIDYCHAHGVLGVADGNDAQDLVHKLSVSHRSIIDIRTSGPLRTSADPGLSDNGHDFFKIRYSADIDDRNPAASDNTPSQFPADRGGNKVVVVANGKQKVREALEAGCDAVEQGYMMGTENLEIMAKQKVMWIPGVLRAGNALASACGGGEVCCRFSLGYAAPGKADPNAKKYWQKMLDSQLDQLRHARGLGVVVGVGTGAGSVGILHGEAMVEEMKWFLKAGYSLEEVICCASENGARFFDMEKAGRLSAGRPATFLVTRGTVKQLPRKLSYLEGIYINGAPCTSYRKTVIKAV